jgi:hypothetical protein
MPTVIRIISRTDGAATGLEGKFLAAYDPSAHDLDGSYLGGILEVTEDPARAIQFPDAAAAMEEWHRTPGCTCHATRPWDGKPNRPLTAFNVAIENVPLGKETI